MREMWRHHAARTIRHVAGPRVHFLPSPGTAVTVLGQKGHNLSELWPLLANMNVLNQRLHFTSRSASKLSGSVRENTMAARPTRIIAIWLACVGVLLCFPGFETRGLAAGLIIGYWPFVLLGQELTNEFHPVVFYLVMFVMSGVIVGLCAGVIHKANLTRTVWRLLVFSMISGASLCVFDGIGLEEWQRSPAISQATEHSGIEPGRWDFARQVTIPKTITGGLWGLYLTSGIGLLWSLIVMVQRNLHQKFMEQAFPGGFTQNRSTTCRGWRKGRWGQGRQSMNEGGRHR